jgi:hypothetical protein
MASVMFRIGDILESGADLTTLPCSTKGHISTTAETRVQRFGLPLPSINDLGEIEISRFPGSVSRIIAWAASVKDRRSSPGAIRSIGEHLGSFVNENEWVQILESPLLGTGAGGLDAVVAGRALRDGFLATCKTDALLIVYGQMAATINTLREFVDNGRDLDVEEVNRTSEESGIEPIGASTTAPGVFISYSHRDEKFLDQLRIHLKPLEHVAVLDAWSDKQIAPGSEWFKDIKRALARAKVAILLVTPHFLASDFIRDHELAPLLKKAATGGVHIMWIPVRACSYTETALKDYQAVIPPNRPLATMKADRDGAWVAICESIKKALEKRSR